MLRLCAALLLAGTSMPALAQTPTNIDEMARTPLVRVNISETLRTPPDEASLTVGTQSKASTATAAVALSKTRTEKLLPPFAPRAFASVTSRRRASSFSPIIAGMRSPAAGGNKP